MGEQIGTAVSGILYYVGKDELDRLRTLNAAADERIAVFADACRLNTLYMIARAGSGHIGSSFSSLDIVSLLQLDLMKGDDLYFSSKGHDAPGLYALLIAIGKLPFDKIHGLRKLGGLPGHPDVGVPGMVVNSGSLGMGISKAKGIVKADRLSGRKRTVYVLTGDGELQEGQIWESLVSAANNQTGEITVIVDHNKLQSDLLLTQTSDLGDLEAKFRAFGWEVGRCDGHDVAALRAELARLATSDLPKILIADTIKGQGVSFMEHTAMESDAAIYRFHSGAPGADDYRRAAQELLDRVNSGLAVLGASAVLVETVDQPAAAPAAATQRLVPAYGEALLAAAAENPKIVALDADLLLDTGLIPFKAKYPDRFIECGIAEMDMVSQAGGLALSGFLPVVHSFACFLTPRANEQIYNNATERSKVVYAGSLAGLLPGGPGHSHQAVRDIAALGGIPGLTMVEPSCIAAVAPLVRHCLAPDTGSAYIRLVSIPYAIPFAFPDAWTPEVGRGVVLREGTDGVVVGYGPVMLTEAWHAVEALAAAGGPNLTLVDLPWLNRIDATWLAGILAGRKLATIDNHYVDGGQGGHIAAALAGAGGGASILRLGVQGIPVSGTNPQVLAHHRLDRAALAEQFRTHFG